MLLPFLVYLLSSNYSRAIIISARLHKEPLRSASGPPPPCSLSHVPRQTSGAQKLPRHEVQGKGKEERRRASRPWESCERRGVTRGAKGSHAAPWICEPAARQLHPSNSWLCTHWQAHHSWACSLLPIKNTLMWDRAFGQGQNSPR